MASARSLLWLRVDLRIDDNLALQAACKGAQSLLPVYVFDPAHYNRGRLGNSRKCGARRARFVMECVSNLRQRLEAKGSGLAVYIGRASDILPQVSAATKADSVHVQQGVCSEEINQENLVAKRLEKCKLKRVWGGTLYMPDDIGNDPDNIPLLFTQFKNRAEGRGCIREPVNSPAKCPALPESSDQNKLTEALSFMPTLVDLGFPDTEATQAMKDDPRAVMPFPGGEDAALARLQKWMWDDDKLKDYFDIRNGMLGEGYSSKLSPWLAMGCISPRRVWKEAQKYEQQRTKNKSTYWLIFELTWRDFYLYMGRGYGDKIFTPGGITGEQLRWKGGDDALRRWKEGRTGDQLVDANMKELKATGFMSNRGRQNVASYLIFDLSVDWRYGAAHFEEYLLDYDPCSNWGNWVAAAGLTGQRVNKFNTKKQLNDYDPQRKYVRHWLEGGKADEDVDMGDADDAKLRAREKRFGTGDDENRNPQKAEGKGAGKKGKSRRDYDEGKSRRGYKSCAMDVDEDLSGPKAPRRWVQRAN